MANWIKQWELPEESWLNEDLRYSGAWFSLIRMAEIKDRKIVRNGLMIEAKRGTVYTSIHELADRWHVSRKWVRHFLDMLIADEMVTELQRDHRGYHLKVNNYAKYQDRQDHRGTTKVTTKDTTEVTTEGTTEGTTEATFFRTNNTEYTEYTEGERGATRQFDPPTVNEVNYFCYQSGLKVNAERFVNYYAARDWKDITDWRAAVRAWAARDGTETKQKPAAKKFDNFEPRETEGSAMDEYIKRLEEGYD